MLEGALMSPARECAASVVRARFGLVIPITLSRWMLIVVSSLHHPQQVGSAETLWSSALLVGRGLRQWVRVILRAVTLERREAREGTASLREDLPVHLVECILGKGAATCMHSKGQNFPWDG
jgi:hypothetical protein